MAGKVARQGQGDGKVTVAVSWAAACGGCDVSILDLEEAVLGLAEAVDFVYWPVALDYKREHLRGLADGSVDVGVFNGAVRTSEQEEDARLMRAKCRLLVSYGACACFGGIPGLANGAGRDELLQTVYGDTASTDNPEQVRPAERTPAAEAGQGRGGDAELELPRFDETVRALHQVVDVDVFAPGCPPVPEKVGELAELLSALAAGGEAPAPGTFLAADRGLCEECPRRHTRGQQAVETFVRPHQVVADESRCLLDQGLTCMGIATRGGCGARCIEVNMPCRGCYGPLPHALDPAVELVSALAALPGPRGTWETPVHKIVGPARSVKDPLGTFYRFTYPVSPGRRTVKEEG